MKPDDVFSCESCRAVYVALARSTVETLDEARCGCCGIVMVSFPDSCAFELVNDPETDLA